MSLNTTPRTWVVGEIVTAAEMNTEVRDAITGLQAAWTAYTPALTAATTNPTLGTGNSVSGGYQQVGRSVSGRADIIFGTSGVVVGSGAYAVSLPVACTAAAVTNASSMGHGGFFIGSRYYLFELFAVSTTTCRLVEANAGTFFSNSSPVVPVASNRFSYSFDYQAA